MAAEEDLIVILTTSNPYIEVDENVVESSFQFLEVVNVTFVKEGLKILTPRLSRVTRIGIRQIVGKRAKAGFGCRKNLQGMMQAILMIII